MRGEGGVKFEIPRVFLMIFPMGGGQIAENCMKTQELGASYGGGSWDFSDPPSPPLR